MNLDDRKEISECLDKAWAQIGSYSSDLDLPDPIAFADAGYAWEEYRDTLATRVENGDVLPSNIEVVDLPKDRLTVRPLARLELEHRLLYEAAILAAAPYIDDVIPRAVYSYRWWRREGRLLAPTTSWLRMQRRARKFHQKHPELLLARTDVTAFYENVDVEILALDLGGIHAPDWSISVLVDFLKAYNEMGNTWGLPQSCESSGVLANLYLLPVDEEIAGAGLRHFRYSDDIYVFGEDWISLRKRLLETNRVLRHRRLILSGPKTKIISGRDITREFEGAQKDSINYGLRLEMPEAYQDLRMLFDTAVEEGSLNERDLKYCLTKLRVSHDDYAVTWLLNNMGEIPHMAREALLYLGEFHSTDPQIGKSIVDLLSNSKLVIYPYAEQHLLIYLIRYRVMSQHARDVVWNILVDRNKENFVREFAARYLGIYASLGRGRVLRQVFQEEANHRVQRALLVACYESNQSSKTWLTAVARSQPKLKSLVSYLQAAPPEIPLPRVERGFSGL